MEVTELAYALRATGETLPPADWLDRAFLRRASTLPTLPPAAGRRRVGLVWEAGRWDRTPSVPAEAWRPLADLPVVFYSLQQDAETAPPLRVQSFGGSTARVLDAARAMLELDLVVSVDSMPVHLAGALGVPVALLLKHDADWRWQRGCDDSPWYPRLRLFRQDAAGRWGAAMRALRRHLPGLATAATAF